MMMFDYEADCGQVFHSCATVMDCLGPNPLLTIHGHLGFNAVKEIIRQVEEFKKEHEGQTSEEISTA
jgi:hypothetical protein